MSVKFDFSGKVALITGSSSGIGAGAAILFAKAGAQVVVTGRNASNVASVAKLCSEVSPNKSKALEVVADVSKESDCKLLIDQTIKHFGKLDVLVNNAGIGWTADITDSKFMDAFNGVMNINLNSVVYLTHLSVEHLAKTKGNIINISSVAAILTIKAYSPYCMSKAALDMFTKCMAVELGPKGIRVNSVNPGAVRTNFLIATGVSKKDSDAVWDMHANKYPVGRAGEAEDIANDILYLASDQASFITGIGLFADGGQIAAGISGSLDN